MADRGRSRHRCLTLSLLAYRVSRLKSCLSMGAVTPSPTLVRTGSLCACRRRSTTPTSVVRLRAAALHVLDAATPPLEAAAQAAAPESAQTAQAIEQLRRLGVNLNQALRRGSVIDPERVRDLARAVDDLRASLGDKTVITS